LAKQKQAAVVAAVLHAPVATTSAVLLAVQLLAVQLPAAVAVQLLAAPHLAVVATAVHQLAPAVQHQLATAVQQPLLLAALAPQLLLQQPLLSVLQSHQQRSSSCPYRENLTACDPLDRKPFCIGGCITASCGDHWDAKIAD